MCSLILGRLPGLPGGQSREVPNAYLHIGVCAHTVASVFIYLSIYQKP